MHSKGNLKTRHVRIALVMMIPNKNKTIPMRTQLIRLTSSSPTKGRVVEYRWPPSVWIWAAKQPYRHLLMYKYIF